MSDISGRINGRHDYKTVQIGPKTLRIPLGWELTSLSPDEGATELVTDGSHYSPKQNQKYEYFYATVSDLTNFGINYESCGRINEEQFEEMVRAGCKPKPGDVLFSKDGTVGICTTFTEERDVVVLSSIAIIRPNTDIYLPAYLSYYLLSKLTTDQIRSFKSGTALRRVILKDIKKFKIPRPTLAEQRHIAEILSTVDELIQQTDAIIEETERLKRGLMQDLLTGGIGHESYKRVQIGVETRKIPKTWEVIHLGDNEYADIAMGGTPDTSVDDYWGGNIPWMRSGDLHQRHITKVEGSLTEKGKKAARLDYIPKHSVLVGLNGQGKTKGTVAINEIRLTANQSVGAYIINPEKLEHRYLYYYLDSKYQHLRALAGGGRSGLNLTLLGQVKIAYPPLPEQRRIVEILTTVEDKIQKKQHYKRKLEALKRGLLPDLLTGKVRVPVKT